MTFTRTARRIALLLTAAALLLGLPVAAASAATAATPASAPAGTAPADTGWIRLAHLSPEMPAMDVYLYSFGNPDARFVLHHVAYGTVSAFQSVPAGDYSIAMRMAGTARASQPVLSASVTVTAGHAYTAAAIGPRPGLRLQVLPDDLVTPAGKALVRVIQASLKQKTVTVSWDGRIIAGPLSFDSVTSYRAVAPGTESVTVRAAAGNASSTFTLAAGSVHTLVVLDGAHGLEIADTEDAAGSAQMPAGGAATGFGGTAPHGPGSPLPWLALIGAGALLAAAGGLRWRRVHS
ncbi:MAG: DUF4397 domain-containing protein [Streptosporangiaceae bacterium]